MVGLYHIRTRSVNLFRISTASVDVNILISLLFYFARKGFLFILLYILSDFARRCVSPAVPGGNLFFSQRYWATLRKVYSKNVDYFGQLWTFMLFYQLLSAYSKLEMFSSTDYFNFKTHCYAEIIFKCIADIYTFNTRIHTHISMIMSNRTFTLFAKTYIIQLFSTLAKMQLLFTLSNLQFLFTIIYFKLLFTHIKLLFLFLYLCDNVFIFGFFGSVYNYFYELQFFVAYSYDYHLQYFHRITHTNLILSSLTSTFYVCDSNSLFCCIFQYIND